MTAPAVEVRAISMVFGSGQDRVSALDEVSVDIRQNEFFTLLGPSGCGKTTLLRLIAGFEQPGGGEIRLEGRLLGTIPPYRRPVNTVFQNYALFPHMSVAQNVAFGLEMQGVERAERDRRVREMLALVRLADYGNRRPAQLSGGQQQRVALARALANHPKVLLLDEPLSALDLKLRKEMQLELKRLQLETGITFIFVTHDQQEALTMSDRIAVMQSGHILQVGTPAEIYERPTRRFVADFIGESNFLEADCVADDRFRLDGGGELTGAGGGRSGERQTLAIRPERAMLVAKDEGALRATVDNVVYFGTDTTYYLTLTGGQRFQVRVQNRNGARAESRAGDRVGVAVPPEAVRVLVD